MLAKASFKTHNPLAQPLGAEIVKCTKIMEHFIKPETKKVLVDSHIPVDIIANAKGIAILTVVKAGMLMSFRGGSGIVVAKLADGKWSAPSAITTSGIGGGFQIGAEITDFVIVLNTFAAVNAFSENYITLGGNLSVSAGPFGRNAEASISKQMSPIYSYSKSKGLFAGVSIEGSVISERVEENCKFYKRRVTCRDILGGLVDPPDIAEGLYRALDQRVAAATINPPSYTSFGLATPAGSGGQTSPRPAELKLQPIVESAQCYQSPTKAQANSVPSNGPLGYHEMSPSNAIQPSFSPTGKSKPPIPAKSKQMNIKARALYDYIPDSSTANDDLAFIKGDLITVTDQSLGAWWKGICKGKIGMFPSNYVEIDN